MSITRIVPNLPVADVDRAHALYTGLFGLEVRMNLGWVGNLSPPGTPNAQLQSMTSDESAPCNPVVTVGVTSPDEVDEIYGRAVAVGLEIVHPPTDEQWGVHRSFFRDPDGNVINVVGHEVRHAHVSAKWRAA